MPMFAEALPALQGAEAMAAATIVAYGSGGLKKADSSAVWRSWERAARRNEPARPAGRPEDLAAVMDALGIPVEYVKLPPPEEPE